MIRILSQNPGEDLRGLLDAALLEAERAEGDRRERIVAQYPGQAGANGPIVTANEAREEAAADGAGDAGAGGRAAGG